VDSREGIVRCTSVEVSEMRPVQSVRDVTGPYPLRRPPPPPICRISIFENKGFTVRLYTRDYGAVAPGHAYSGFAVAAQESLYGYCAAKGGNYLQKRRGTRERGTREQVFVRGAGLGPDVYGRRGNGAVSGLANIRPEL
jgi:hypothetical protein